MLPGDRLICAFVSPQEVGTKFTSWKLHVTVVPWFRVDAESDIIASGLTRALKTMAPFSVTGGGEEMVGIRKTRHARLVKDPTALAGVAAKVRTYLHKKGALLIDETTKEPPVFRPHVTSQGNVTMHADDTFRCDRLYIVKQFGVYKEIVGEIPLGTTA